MVNKNFSKLEDELANARKVVFKRPDGAAVMVKTAVVDTNLSVGEHSMRYADKAHEVIFVKDIVSKIRLSKILGVDYVEKIEYNIDSINSENEIITIMDNHKVIGVATKYKSKGVRKKWIRNYKVRYNNLINEISKEYTFRLPDGRVCFGTDLIDYDYIPRTAQITRAIKFINQSTRYRVSDPDLMITIGYIMEKNHNVTLGLINALTGEYLVPLDCPDDTLSIENKARLHKKEIEYLATLTDTEEMIINKLNRGE